MHDFFSIAHRWGPKTASLPSCGVQETLLIKEKHDYVFLYSSTTIEHLKLQHFLKVMSSSVLFSCCFLVFWIAELGRLKLKHTISHVHTNGQQKKEEKEEVRWTVQLVYIKKRVYIYIYKNIKQKSLFFQLLGIKYTGYILDIKYLWSFTAVKLSLC